MGISYAWHPCFIPLSGISRELCHASKTFRFWYFRHEKPKFPDPFFVRICPKTFTGLKSFKSFWEGGSAATLSWIKSGGGFRLACPPTSGLSSVESKAKQFAFVFAHCALIDGRASSLLPGQILHLNWNCVRPNGLSKFHSERGGFEPPRPLPV